MAALNELNRDGWIEFVAINYQEFMSDWPAEAQALANAAFTATLEAEPPTGPAVALGFAALLEREAGALPDDAGALISFLREQVSIAAELDQVAAGMEWSDLFIAGLGQLAETAGNLGGLVDNASQAAENAAGEAAASPGKTLTFLGVAGLLLGGLAVWRTTR